MPREKFVDARPSRGMTNFLVSWWFTLPLAYWRFIPLLGESSARNGLVAAVLG
jgi:hypothetical protein